MTIEELTTLEKLNKAFYETSKASAWKDATQMYRMNLLANNLKLQEELRNGTYKASATVNFRLNERGKQRDIESPAIRDRIVHKVLCNEILIPYLTKSLIYDTYASLKNRGTSFARKRIEAHLRNYIREYGNQGYVLKVDIKKYFASIDHDVLKRMLHKRIHEPKEIMVLIDYIVDISSKTNKGLGLGAEAPQIFAIYYLSRLDSYIKTVKRVKYYGRYMDDILIISNDKKELWQILECIKQELAKVKLEVNDKKTTITKLSHGFTFMQIKYSLDGNKIIKRPTHAKVFREKRRLKKHKTLFDKGIVDEKYVFNCYKSWKNGLLKECNHAKKTIKRMDEYYYTLFPKPIETLKKKRYQIAQDGYKTIGEELWTRRLC